MNRNLNWDIPWRTPKHPCTSTMPTAQSFAFWAAQVVLPKKALHRFDPAPRVQSVQNQRCGTLIVRREINMQMVAVGIPDIHLSDVEIRHNGNLVRHAFGVQ